MRVLGFLGTRPEYLKLWPLFKALADDLEIDFAWLFTGQHKDLIRCHQKELPLVHPKYEFECPLGNLAFRAGRWHEDCAKAIDDFKPDWVLVQGDTQTAWLGAVVAFQMQIPVVHLEAGMRSFDLQNPWPEEGFRKMISAIAQWHLCPTEREVKTLLSEGVPAHRVLCTGNSLYSSFLEVKKQKPLTKSGILLTCHRREVSQEVLGDLLEFLLKFCKSVGEDLLWISHPRFDSDWIDSWIEKGVKVRQALPYPQLIAQLQKARKVLTDSGGMQEECAWLGCDTGILRINTEWVNEFPLLGFNHQGIKDFITKESPICRRSPPAMKWNSETVIAAWKKFNETTN